ncbi:MAG: hypothetical protein H6838_17085 [Planctomycetes bacterium]|nr:hypothetical protein [Planctomycetota bacterium]MCB9887208.1 hypothetical protein [Planctomycetota bacterium]
MSRSPILLSALLFMPALLPAHGGQYVGPPDIVPPHPGGGGSTGRPVGPTTGQPGSPGTPQPSGPVTPGGAPGTTGGRPAPGASPQPGQTGPRGYELTTDLTQWDIWWEMNKNPYLRLREAVHRGPVQTGDDDYWLGPGRRHVAQDLLAPTQQQILDEILPALKKAMDSTSQRDITSSCMVAMAKIGQNHPTFRLVDVFAPRLRENDQEVRETAALALGIAGIAGQEELDLLIGLANDDAVGKRASGGQVNDRTRAFALYGLGLVSHATSNSQVKRKAFAALRGVLADDSVGNRNVKVAAILGMSLLNLDPAASDDQAILAEALGALEDYYQLELGPGQQLIQAHCPTAIVRLIGRDHARADYFKELFAADLQGKGKRKRSSHDIARSCALALGQMAKPCEDKDDAAHPDNRYSRLLLDTYFDHRDQQTRYFALLALGQIGGELNRQRLLREFDKGSKSLEKPWAALALGVFTFAKHERQLVAQEPIAAESEIGATLHRCFKEGKDPNLRAALAVALGLTRTTAAAPDLRQMLIAAQHQEQLAGYLCIGLALMKDHASVPLIRTIITNSGRRSTLLQQAAIALGKLGDKQVADQLQAMLCDGEPNLAKLAAVASALGFIGDRRTVKPLLKMLFDDQLGALSRAFAAVALGGVADRELLPWNTKISRNLNYRAAVETLTNQQSGLLDIL